MRAYELILRLQELIHDFGDKEVFVINDWDDEDDSTVEQPSQISLQRVVKDATPYESWYLANGQQGDKDIFLLH